MSPSRSLLQNISTDALVRRDLVPICVIRDTLMFLNGRGAALLGRPGDEFPKGLPLREVVAEADWPRVARSLRRTTLKPGSGVSIIFSAVRKDGSIMDLELTGTVVAGPRRNRRGRGRQRHHGAGARRRAAQLSRVQRRPHRSRQPHALPRPAAPVAAGFAPDGRRVRAARMRPRRFQVRQRHVRSRGGRPGAPGCRGEAAIVLPRGGHGSPHRRRRVRAHPSRRIRSERRGAGGKSPDRRAGGADRGRRRLVFRGGQRRHRALSAGRTDHRNARPRGRRRDVRKQGIGRELLELRRSRQARGQGDGRQRRHLERRAQDGDRHASTSNTGRSPQWSDGWARNSPPAGMRRDCARHWGSSSRSRERISPRKRR